MLPQLIALLPLVALPPSAAPLPPREAAAAMKVPPGFKVTLFAGEPDVKQPIAFCFDDRGRLWVVECYSYPKWHIDPKDGKDRVLIFEDTDGDGQFDKRTVFADKLSNLSGIEYGFGGIWLCSLPHLIFIPIKDDKPSGPPEVKLHGWSMKAGHNVFNSLKWGPDGWLYGCNGILAESLVGPPGTPDKERVRINCGVWRYHPTKKKFEAYAHGTTNPFGLDWDEHGEMFITNCVIAHLWHVVPGAHFERMFGSHYNPHLYGLMKTCADHLHWAGGSWTDSREGKGAHSVAGGGHAHVGCMIYLGDNFPKSYRNAVFMGNLHGNRLNVDLLERKGSSYVARHGNDFLFANDPWFRPIAINYGPDGGVYVTDWCDTGECHNYKVADTKTGRIFKITYGTPKHEKIDLEKLSDAELVKLQDHENEWFVRHARRLLQERAASGKLQPTTPALVIKSFPNGDSRSRFGERQLRYLWTLNAINSLNPRAYRQQAVQAWAVRLLLESPLFEDGDIHLAIHESSAQVRLAWASALQRLTPAKRLALAQHLVQNADDSEDPYIPLMIWYGIEPLVAEFPEKGVSLLRNTMLPLVRENLTRRILHGKDAMLEEVLRLLESNSSPAYQRDVLKGIASYFTGQRSVKMPRSWAAVFAALSESPLPEVRDRALALAVLSGDARARNGLKQLCLDAASPAEKRRDALRSLLQSQSPDLLPLLQQLLDDSELRSVALTGLAAFADARTANLILDKYRVFSDDEKLDAIATLSSRPAYALALLDAIAKKQIPRQDLSQATIRQLLALNNKEITAKVNEVWGTLRPSSAEKAALMAKYRKQLTSKELKNADLVRGRMLYNKACAACHRLFGEGGAVGPDITGAQRASLDYLLENIVDPSAVVPREFQVAVVTTTSGRVLTGIVKELARAITVQTQNELVTLPRDEVESLAPTKNSMMPDGILNNLSFAEIRDLIAYLSSPTQIPLAGRK